MMDLAHAPEDRPGQWHSGREGVRAALLLAAREVRTALRTPAHLLPNMLAPFFFYVVMVGSFEAFAARSGIANWEAFLVPMAIIFAAQGGSAGLNLVRDIESGYFDKLLVTPTSRFALLIGAMSADFLRVMAQAVVVLLLAVAFGLEFATGWPGALALILLSGCWGLAYSGIGFAVALRSGNAQATQSVGYLALPFMFLTTMFAPKEDLSGWLATASTFNPMTYLLRGMRALTLEGWNGTDLGVAALAVAAVGGVSITLAFLALRGRVQ